MWVDRRRVATAVALGAAGISVTCQAQVQQPGFFGSLSGWYQFSGNSDTFLAAPSGFITGKPGPDDGFGGGARAGYRFSEWDLALAGRYTWYTKGRGSIPAAPTSFWERARNGVGDLEIGYNTMFDSVGVRVAAGPRIVKWKQHGEADNGGAGTTRYAGGGGVAKVAAAAMVAPSWSLFGGVEASLTHGKTKGDFGFGSIRRSTTASNLGGEIGIAYEIAPLVNIGIGYQLDAWWSAGRKFDITSAGYTGGIDRFNHGPFVRLAYNWGAPPSGAAAPAPVPGATGSFIIFFDFDRADLTPTALQTIRQAAAQAKTGKSTRIDVTGHADRAGSDAYNMALSLRRGNAVKDQIVREGVPANQIAVVGKGESQPLVPTADGVREPQNRRVEIVLQ